MIKIKDLFKNAIQEISGIYPDAQDIRLEEFEKNSNMISISFLLPLPETNPLRRMTTIVNGAMEHERIYKSVIFNEDGDTLSLKIYKDE